MCLLQTYFLMKYKCINLNLNFVCNQIIYYESPNDDKCLLKFEKLPDFVI